MIDLARESVLSLKDACDRLPRRRAGSKPHLATLYRWAQHGCRGVKLEVIQVGGTLCTSIEALQRFFNALSGDRSAAEPANEDHEHTQTEAALAEIGI